MCHTSLNSKKSSSFFKLYHLLVNFSILFMYRKSLANQGLYKKKLDTNQDTHSIKIGVQLWCERRDLNPYGITTRPSNVRVCRFRHSRRSVLNRCLCSLRTLTIIAKGVVYVKPFFKVFSIFFPLFLSGVWCLIIRFLKPLFCRR